MNRGDVLSLALKRLGQRSNDTKLTAFLDAELTQIIETWNRGVRMPNSKGTFMPWFVSFLDTTSLVLSANVNAYATPAGYLRDIEYDDTSPLWLRNSSGPYKALRKDDFHVLQARYAGKSAAEPEAYALFNLGVYVFPTPDTTYNTQWAYYVKLDGASATMNWYTYAGEMCEAELRRRGARYYTRDADMAEQASTDLAEEIIRLHTDSVLFQEAGRMFSRGDD